MKQISLIAAGVVFAGALLFSWITHGTGVVKADPDRNISIPDQLTVPLQVRAAYNDRTIFFNYRWPAARPSILHDVLRYEDGEWIREGRAVPGSEPNGLHEDRVAMMLDDGSVPEFGRYGGYITIGAGLAGLTDEAPEEVTKYLPATRTNPDDWADIAPDDTQARLREAGYFIDLWHWRAHRSNPLGASDDQYVGSKRGGDSGQSPYSTNWNGDANQPTMMFNPEVTGFRALKWDDVVQGNLSQDSIYYLSAETAVPFDPDAGWQNGDVIPRRILRMPQGSRGDIGVVGRGEWADGHWDVTLARALDTRNPQDDKILKDLGAYDVAFAIHRDATGGRWHYVSLPHSLGLGREAEITAAKFTGTTPAWGEWTDVTLFYPGQVTWPHLKSATHAGAKNIDAGVPVKFRHSEEQLANYGIEAEFRSEIRRQWILTLLAGVILIGGFGVALNMTLNSRKGA